jgi:hypothetical protein
VVCVVAGRAQRPLVHAAISRHGAVQHTAGVVAVHILDVLNRERAEVIDIEVRIACDQRIGGPEHDVDAERLHGFALELLQPGAKSKAACVAVHCEHI